MLWPILAVTGQPPLHGEPQPKISYWENLVAQLAAAGDQRVVLSSEFFAQSDDATARRVITDLGRNRVHVVVTLRSLPGSCRPSGSSTYRTASTSLTWNGSRGS